MSNRLPNKIAAHNAAVPLRGRRFSMKKIVILLPALLLLGIVFRLAQVRLGSSGEGNGAESPDKRFLAHAESFYTTRFWGGSHNYYEFTIMPAKGQPKGRSIHHIVMDEPPQGMFGVRQDDWIQWSADSSVVTFSFKGTKLTLSVNP